MRHNNAWWQTSHNFLRLSFLYFLPLIEAFNIAFDQFFFAEIVQPSVAAIKSVPFRTRMQDAQPAADDNLTQLHLVITHLYDGIRLP